MSLFLVVAEAISGVAAVVGGVADGEGSRAIANAKAAAAAGRCKQLTDGKLCTLQCGCVWSQDLNECFDDPWPAYTMVVIFCLALGIHVWVYTRIHPWLMTFWETYSAARVVYLSSVVFAACCGLFMWGETVWNPIFAARAKAYRPAEYAILVGAIAYPLALYAYYHWFPSVTTGVLPMFALAIVASGIAVASYIHLRTLGKAGRTRDYANMIAPYYLFFHVACIEVLVWFLVFWK